MGAPDIRKMITIKIKPRKDSYSDQFSRIVMVKMMMLTAAITGISWAKDKFTCIVPNIKDSELSSGFAGKACWINGVYIYNNLPKEHQGLYYGIPDDITKNGLGFGGSICDTTSSQSKNCEPLEKEFFLQYQWFPLGAAAIGFLYYLPYLFYCVVNSDLILIKDMVKKKKTDEVNYNEIIEKLFLRRNNSSSMLNARILLNVIVKACYVITNVVAMLIVDTALNGRFLAYGKQWSKWMSLSSHEMHDYMKSPRDPKAGHELLPGFGLCEVQTSGKDEIISLDNQFVVVCELSQHVLYQYILIVLWHMLIAGIVISIIGLIKHVFDGITTSCCIAHDGSQAVGVYSKLALRERQYMEYVRTKNMPVFAELLQRLKEAKGMKRSSFDSSNEEAHSAKQNMMAE